MDFEKLVAFIKQARETATDEVALQAKELYKEWDVSVIYGEGERVRYADKLYKCRQAHTSEYTPDLTPALWSVIDETHKGTVSDPIPYDPNMVVFEGLYYIYNDVVYKCIRDSGNPLYAEPSALIGNYFEVA